MSDLCQASTMSKGFGDSSKSKKRVIDSKDLLFIQEEKKAFRLFQEKKIDEAIVIYESIIGSGYDSFSLYAHLGLIRMQQGNFSSAIDALQRALAHEPCNIDILSKIAYSYHQLKDFSLSRKWYLKCVCQEPNSELLFFNFAELEKDAGEIDAAINLYQKGIALNSNNFRALSNLGALYEKTKDYPQAIDVYRKAIALAPKISHLKVDLISCKSFICDWSEVDIDSQILKTLGLEGEAISPFELMPLEDAPEKHLIRAKNFYIQKFKRKEEKIAYVEKSKIRIGYFSADCYRHAVMYLMQRVLEVHDKKQFEIYIYSSSLVEDDLTQDLRSRADVFRDISNIDDKNVVALAREDNIDIAVDLNGYTQNTRLAVFAYRVAPIQVSYLGFPGTTGADCMDYLIADKVIIPDSHQKYYTEKIIYMPNSYQCNDNQRTISKKLFKRRELGLPENSFVFACFNANNKITPDVFRVWMNLLSNIENSVLWLYRSNYFSERNLRQQAVNSGIDSSRIIFADRMPLDDHLSRLRSADLVLDTFNYNAHTTASDALWAGVPVVTKLGESFSSRVCSSLLAASGLSELIAQSTQEYEDIASRLASNASELGDVKERLRLNLSTCPLFDTERFTRDLESVFSSLVKQL